jgi:PAS domain S-box-containing protein
VRPLSDEKNYKFFMDLLTEYDNFIICSETDLDGKITFASKGFCRISGYTRDELIGKSHNIVRDEDNSSELFRYIWNRLRKQETFIISQMSNKAKDGSLYYVESNFSPLYDNNILIGYRSLRRDITGNVRLKLFNDRLTSDNISLGYTNEEIKTTLKKSHKEISIFHDDLIAMFTHELKTPLNAIINFSLYIKTNIVKDLTPKIIERINVLANKIYNNGLIQKEIIDSALDLATIKSGKIEVRREYINMNNFLTPIIDRYQGIYNKKIILDFDKSTIGFVDKKLCGIVFSNILSNALKYAHSKVLVTLIPTGVSFEITIEDDGLGIQKEDRERIFDLYTQGENKSMLNMEQSGTGIGLHTVKLLMKLCEKQIVVNDSAILGGAKFIIKEEKI